MKTDLLKRILKISYENGLAHIGSCVSALPILLEIYNKKNPEDIVIMDNAHAHLAHLVVKEENDILLLHYLKRFGIHCDRKSGCDASGGSLGHGIGISIGYALAYPSRAVYCLVSDGSMMEGSNWEALRIKKDLNLTNLHIYTNFNGFIATRAINSNILHKAMEINDPSIQFRYTDFYGIKALTGVNAHYKTLSKEEYEQSLKDIVERDYLENAGV